MTEDGLCEWVGTFEDAEKIRKAYEVDSSITFVSGKKEANFGRPEIVINEKSRVRFNDVGDPCIVPYDGTPFIILARCERHCIFGKDKHKKKKNELKEGRDSCLKGDHPVPRKRKQLLQASKKKGCQAKIVMKDVVFFPDYQVKKNTEKIKRNASEHLRDDLSDVPDNVNKQRRIYILLPKREDHGSTHLTGQLAGFMNPLSKEVRDKLGELVGHGVTSVSEMRRHLHVYVDTLLFKDMKRPALSDAAYYPTDETIRTHIYLAQLRLRYSRIDQENLLHKVAEWQENYPRDNFVFMPASNSAPSDNEILKDIDCVEQDDDDEVYPQIQAAETTEFFFCHQSEFQRHLLYRYGNSLCLLDATYRTTKYALPLFFLAVKTNVGYSVVAEFIVQHETKKSIMQGLRTIKGWLHNAQDRPAEWSWEPKFFMTDFCEREIVAIEEVFPESFVFICDFHREQSWTRWVSKTDNGLTDCKDQVLGMLRRCAHASSEKEYTEAITKLQNSDIWARSSRLRNWFTKTWMTEKKRWVWSERYGSGLLVNTNNGLERQNKVFKYQFLEQRKNNNVSGMISSLVHQYLPAMMLKNGYLNFACKFF